METHTSAVGIELQVEGCGLRRPLLSARQPRKAGGKRISDPELHSAALKRR
jgi:hypothetical protein